MNTTKLESWLKAKNYRPSTVKYTVRQAKQAYAAFLGSPETGPQRDLLTSLKRVVAYGTDTKDAKDFVAWLQSFDVGLPNRSPLPAPASRKLPAESFSEQDYHQILHVTGRGEEPEAHVLFVLATTGLRIGDVLRIPLDHLEVALKGAQSGSRGILPLERKGGTWIQIPIAGSIEAWRRLHDESREYENIAGYVTGGESESPEPGDMAYVRCHRYFKRIGDELKLAGRVHLHRLRRTVAVRGLAATDGDLVAVSQLLGHASIASTQRYVDEINVSRVASIQQKIRLREND